MDTHPLPQTSLGDLDPARIRQHIETAISKGRYRGPDEPLRFLVQHQAVVPVAGVAEPVPTITGMLMFGRDPQVALPHAVVDLAQFYGSKPLSYEVLDFQKALGGRLPDQIDQIERYLWKNTLHGFRLGEGAQRVEEHEYLPSVLRELTVNAVAHRDYAVTESVIRVSLFRDRIEWTSPGALPAGVTLANILDAQHSRNPAILTLLYQAGYVEGFGMGLNTVFEAMSEEGLAAPQLVESPISFTVTVAARPRGEFDIEDGHAPGDVARGLSPAQRTLYTFIRQHGEASFAEVEAAAGGRSRRSIQRDLKSLIDAGFLDTIGATWQLRYVPRR